MAAKAKQESTAVIPRRTEVDGFVGPMTTDAEKSLKFVEDMTIKNAAEREFASNALATIALRHDQLEEKRLAWVGPLKAVATDIDSTFRKATKPLKAAIDLIKKKIGSFDVEQAQKRAALLKESAAAGVSGDREAAQRAYEKAEKHAAADEGASSTLEWTGEVTDPDAIPANYRMPDFEKLDAITKATNADPKIPGWRAFQIARVRTSRKGVA